MKTFATLVLLLCGSVCWGQGLVLPPPFDPWWNSQTGQSFIDSYKGTEWYAVWKSNQIPACVPDTYHNCGNSPLTSYHGWRDTYPLPDTIVGTWSSQNDPVPPFWIGTIKCNKYIKCNKRLFTIDSVTFLDTDPGGPRFNYISYCSFPWSPPQPIGFCKGEIYWYPTSTNVITATLWIRAHFNDDGSDASHSVVLVGRGLSEPR